jgi:predicted deacetylase
MYDFSVVDVSGRQLSEAAQLLKIELDHLNAQGKTICFVVPHSAHGLTAMFAGGLMGALDGMSIGYMIFYF